MLKIYNPGGHVCDNLQGCYHKNFLPFDIESKDWIHTPNRHEADIIAIHGHDIMGQHQIYDKVKDIRALNLRPEQKLLIMHVFHIDHCFPDKKNYLFVRKVLEQEIPNEFAIVHTNFALNMEIQYDFLFNRQKIYFTDYNRINLSERLYVMGADIKNFELRPIKKQNDNQTNSMKKFLCPNRIYQGFDHDRFKYRRQLFNFIKQYPNQGHYSDFSAGLKLDPENTMVNNFLVNGGWYPVANHYYQGTFFSLYCETIIGKANDDYPYRSITEKTWDPLIKGHFILPFGYQGIIDDIKSYGFKLPDWIDYSFDCIEDNDLRFEMYLESAKKLMSIEINDLMKLYDRDRDILVYNRNLFWELPYDSLHDKVVKFFANYN